MDSQASSSQSFAQNHWLPAPERIPWLTRSKCRSTRIPLEQFERPPDSSTVIPQQIPLEEKVEEIAIHDIWTRDKSDVLYTVVVTPQTKPPINFNELRRICTASDLICPIAQIPYKDSQQKKYRDIVALVYHPFETMHTYLKQRCSTRDPSFVGFMNGVTRGLNKLQQNGYGPGSISCDTLVMGRDDREGSLILLSVKREGRDNEVCEKEFKTLKKRIGDRVRVVKEQLNRDLDALLMCMNLASSPAKRSRLVEAPLFYSDDEKVHILLPMLYLAMWASEEFKAVVEGKTLDSKALATVLRNERLIEYKEVKVVWETTTGSDTKFMRNAFDVCRFVCNCLYHLNAKYWEIVGTTEEVAPLLRDSSLFIAYIERRLFKDLFNVLFKCTFECDDPIFLFDYIHS